MAEYAGCYDVQPGGTYFNNLYFLNSSWQPENMCVFFNSNNLAGIKVLYTNGQSILMGNETSKTRSWIFRKDEFTQSVKITAHDTDKDSPALVDSIALSSNFDIYVYAAPSPSPRMLWKTYSLSPGVGWDIRGFYGSYHPQIRLQQLGVIWGNEKPGDPSLQSGVPLYQEGARDINVEELLESTLKHTMKGKDFRLSLLAGDSSSKLGDTSTVFNSLDSIDKT